MALSAQNGRVGSAPGGGAIEGEGLPSPEEIAAGLWSSMRRHRSGDIASRELTAEAKAVNAYVTVAVNAPAVRRLAGDNTAS